MDEAGERIMDVRCTDDSLAVDLADGRTIIVPIGWYPRLAHGTPAERSHWELIGRGEGIHWPDLDEDIAVQGLIEGRSSSEGPKSFKRWLDTRSKNSAG